MSLLIIGTVALDTIETPFGRRERILGGSGIHAAMAASFFSQSDLVSVIGEDFPGEFIEFLRQRNIGLAGLKTISGKTFEWEGYYEYDMNQAHTRATHLNALLKFDPVLPKELIDAEYVFLANLDPEIQLKVIGQLKSPKLIAADTMNFWIENKKSALEQVINRVDFMLMNEAEIRQFIGTPNIPKAAKTLLGFGIKGTIIKKGEHGALLFESGTHFSAGSYPQEELKDPTGAGDSFAGGFMGYLASSNDLSETNFRRAVILGSVMASFNVEDFSLNRLKRLTKDEIFKRFEEFKNFSKFD